MTTGTLRQLVLELALTDRALPESVALDPRDARKVRAPDKAAVRADEEVASRDSASGR